MGHPNRLPFAGVLAVVDAPSDASPSGARGHRVILTRAAVQAALPGLIGMAVNYRNGWAGHDVRQKVGIISAAGLEGNELRVEGYLFAKDFPELEQNVMLAADRLGMSYELDDAHVEDMRSYLWTLTRVTFIGAAVLMKEHAAYKSTSFRLTGDAFSDGDAREFGERMVASVRGVAS